MESGETGDKEGDEEGGFINGEMSLFMLRHPVVSATEQVVLSPRVGLVQLVSHHVRE